MKHVIYVGHHHNGGALLKFGRCKCGAYLKGEEAIEEHRKLVHGEEKKIRRTFE